MLAAVPAPDLSGFQVDAIAEGAEAATDLTEMQKYAIHLLHATTAYSARLLKAGLAAVASGHAHERRAPS